MDPTLIPIHTKVRGRARFKIRSLTRSPDLSRRVGRAVRRLPGVTSVRANPVTGSLLVFFPVDQDWRTIAEMIADLLKNAAGAPVTTDNTGPAQSAVSRKWHRLQADRILELVDSSIDRGLDPESVDHRMRLQGGNVIHEARLRSRAETLKDQFKFLPMALLLAESVATLAGGAAVEAAMLSTLTAVNVLVGFLIDRRSEQAIAAYRNRPRPRAIALRSGAWVEVPGENLVVGDILKLLPGTYVGADCRIIKTFHLKIDESILTGESHPVDKIEGVIAAGATPLFDQHNMAFMGTLVVGGEGVAVVVATGAMTEYGKLNTLFSETIPPQTPVIGKIHGLSATLVKSAFATGLGVGLIGLLRGRSPLQAVGRTLSIVASAVPAGLISAATVNMVLGFRRLKHENVSIRRLYSLESLSAVQMICFDKTGTLTRSRIDVQRIFFSGKDVRVSNRAFWIGQSPFAPLEDPDFRRLLEASMLCSESKVRTNPRTGREELTGSPTEVALLHLAMMAGLDPVQTDRRYPLQKVRHRGEARHYMVSVHGAPGGRSIVFVKGNPSEVLEMCTWRRRNGRRARLTEAAGRAIEIENQQMAGDALRVLGFACGTFNHSPEEGASFGELTWIGLVGLAEPIRKGVASLMEELHAAGIETVMITGDQSTTAGAVARRIGLSGKPDLRIFESSRLDALTPELASALIRDVHVFSRTDPAQKLRIVQAYQHRGMVVAMTGDGINDGPALRAADVGMAMGLSGTEAAREVADMVLERDNITSVSAAIVQGRAAYRNLKRALRYFMTANFSDMLLSAAASTTGPGAALLAFRPIQIDLLTDLTPGLALLMEPASPNIGREPPRDREEPLFSNRDMTAMLSESAVLTGGALAAFGYGLVRYGPVARAATLAYGSLSAAKLLHALTCRPRALDTVDAARRPNPWLNAALVLGLAAQAGMLLIPGLRTLFNIAPLNFSDLAVVGSTAWATRFINQRIREVRQVESKWSQVITFPESAAGIR